MLCARPRLARRVGEEEAKVNVDERAVGVEQNVSVVPVLDLRRQKARGGSTEGESRPDAHSICSVGIYALAGEAGPSGLCCNGDFFFGPMRSWR
eukprot:4875973-Pleurochrysis_carterae.AAC.1